MSKPAHPSSYVERVIGALQSIQFEQVSAFVEALVDARLHHRSVYFIGNGGSSSTASHMATDLGVGSQRVGAGVRAISLVDNVAVVTATGNDEDFTEIFSRQISLLARPGDILVAISASGNSPNVVAAVRAARDVPMTVVALTGFTGGTLRGLADIVVHVDTEVGDYGPAEDAHLVVNHMVTELLRARHAPEREVRDLHG